MTASSLGDLEEYLPHRGPALLVSDLLSFSDRELCIEGCIPEDHPLVTGRDASILLAVEFAAQAAGVLIAIRAGMTRDAAPKSGYLAQVQDTKFARPTLSTDGTLKATVSFQASLGGVSVVRFSVTNGGDEVALGKLAIAITDEGESS